MVYRYLDYGLKNGPLFQIVYLRPPDCQVREKERELLKSPQRPIVLLKKRKGSFPIAESIAPGNG
ncbi:MAG TPA: hypothetical protein ENH97_00845, partial [bacterium]|nr:hypothetical protein [bacterium]